MRLVFIIAIVFGVAACGSGNLPPTAPTPPAPPVPVADPPAPKPPTPLTGPGVLWIMVFPGNGNSGICLPGAAVEVVIDGTVVQSGPQITPCDYWGYDGGMLFKNLPVAEVTVRASAEGYVTGEVTATPSSGGYSVTAIVLQRQN